MVHVSKAADRSRRMRTEERESAMAVRRASVTQRRAVSVEGHVLKPFPTIRKQNLLVPHSSDHMVEL